MNTSKYQLILYKCTFVLACFIILTPFLIPLVRAAGASLYLSPSSGTFFVGSTFDVSVFVNTNKNNVNAVKVEIKFDPHILQIANPTTGKSFIQIWVAQPTYSNADGFISFQGGLPTPGINTSAGLVSTITFRAIAPGKTYISILESSQVLLDDGKGTNILSSIDRGFYEINIPPPKGPIIFSSSHPDQNAWYQNNNPTFSWEKEEKVTDFSYTIDQSPNTVPDNDSEGEKNSVSYTGLESGVWYFHLKAKKEDIWGDVSHYIIRIDNVSPASFQIEMEPKLKIPDLTTKQPFIFFMTTDQASGLSHYVVKTVRLTEARGETGFFVEASSPFQLPLTEPGEYQVIVRAYDQAGNWRDIAKKIQIVDIKKFYISTKGLLIFGLIILWWQLILVLFILLVLLAIVFWWRLQKKRKLEDKTQQLQYIKNKISEQEKEIQKFIKTS